MDNKHVTAYTEFGIKIFSKDPADEADLDTRKESFSLRDHYTGKKAEKPAIPLRGSYITTIDKYKNEFYANPNYLVSYE
jgi:other hect domain ubiquitin protein ligase E3